MFNFFKWLENKEEADRREDNAKSAREAYCAHSVDRVHGTHRVVDTNLERIARREEFESSRFRSKMFED